MEEQGRILSLSGGLYRVKTDTDEILCYAKGSFRRGDISPVAGDLVMIDRGDQVGKKEYALGARGLITKILPRKNVLIRPPLANLDTLFLVAAVKDPDPVLLSLDKMLSIAKHNDMNSVLIFTKKELDPEGTDALCEKYQRAGFDAFGVSNLEEEKTRELLYPAIKGNICALAGASGVGKSTLLNTLFPQIGAETGAISVKTQRGKHTTRQSTLYHISSLLGVQREVFVADTPGFSLLDFERFFFMEKDDLAFSFPEFVPLLGECKYTKCSHRTEEGCRILEEVKKGNISPSRHESYITLYEELSRTKAWETDKKKTRR
jgi:ribosome biogenesis GTPase